MYIVVILGYTEICLKDYVLFNTERSHSWPSALAWKAGTGETLSRVRIPSSPPDRLWNFYTFIDSSPLLPTISTISFVINSEVFACLKNLFFYLAQY